MLDALIEEHCDLQDSEDALIEKHLTKIRERKAEIKRKAKDDYDIPVVAFNARATLRRIEREDDDVVVLAVNRLFRATPVGKNVDLVTLVERVAEAQAAKQAEAATKAEAKTKAKMTETTSAT